jgi:hypothetical protein
MLGRLFQYLNNVEDSIPDFPKAILEAICLVVIFFAVMFFFAFVL